MLVRRTLVLGAAVLALLAACTPSSQLSTADATPTPPAATPTATAPTTTAPPTGQPAGRPPTSPPTTPSGPGSGPPKTPTDQLPTDIVAGTVMADSSGPCYAVQTDDGVLYA